MAEELNQQELKEALLAREIIKKYHGVYRYQIGDEITGLHNVEDDVWDIDGLLEAQHAKTLRVATPIIEKRERDKIIIELDNIFYLAPNDDSYLRILVKDLYQAIKDGKWAEAELGQVLEARQR